MMRTLRSYGTKEREREKKVIVLVSLEAYNEKRHTRRREKNGGGNRGGDIKPERERGKRKGGTVME